MKLGIQRFILEGASATASSEASPFRLLQLCPGAAEALGPDHPLLLAPASIGQTEARRWLTGVHAHGAARSLSAGCARLLFRRDSK